MERMISDEEKLRRAIEISQRRNNEYIQNTTRVNVNEKKDYKLFKKMILQIVICLLIYIIFYLITSTNYVFSDDVIKGTNDILNKDINFLNVYNNFMSFMKPKDNLNQVQNDLDTVLENNTIQTNQQIIENSISAENVIEENINLIEQENTIKNQEEKNKTENIAIKEEAKIEKSQMDVDAEKVKKTCKFVKPLSGTITSEFGEREVTSKVMSADHKGIDIAANSGTSIKAAMSGTVKVAEENSEYGKFIKIVNGDVMTVYAHCKKLKVKVGDKVKLGETIATVGSTGNSTGPHLHFEIRLENRYINPRYVIQF